MKAILFAAALFAALGGSRAYAEPVAWAFDYEHSEIRFGWDHWGVSTQHAEFDRFEGELILDRDALESSRVSVTIDTRSLHTGVVDLDEHLQRPHWIGTAEFPQARFVSTGVRRTGVNTAFVDGELTLKGITRPVTLDVVLTYDGLHPLTGVIDDPSSTHTVGFTAHTSVLRSDFGMTASRPWVSDLVDIDIIIEATASPGS